MPAQQVQYLGTVLDSVSFRASPSQQRVEKLLSIREEFLSSRLQPASSWQVLLGVLSSLSHLIPGGRLSMRSLQLTLHCCWDRANDSTLIPWDNRCLQDLSWWLDLDQVSPDLDFWSDASDLGWGAHLGREVVSGRWSPEDTSLSINARELLAVEQSHSFSPSGHRLHGLHLCRQLHGGGLPSELGGRGGGGGGSFCVSQQDCAADFSLGGVSLQSSGPSDHHGSKQCPRRCPVQTQPDPGLQVDAEDGGLRRTTAPLASHGRPLCHLSQSPLFSLLFSFLRSLGSGDRCAAPQLGPSTGVCIPSVGLDYSSGPSQTPLIVWCSDDTDSSVLASMSLVSGPSGSGSGFSDRPSSLSRSSQTTALPSSSSRGPQAVASCVETIQRFARAAGFSFSVAVQVGLARRPSSHTNY